MTFIDWLYSERPEGLDLVALPWGILHITVLLSVILLIVLITLIFRKKEYKKKRIVMMTITIGIIFFELARRIINLTRGDLVVDGNIDWFAIIHRLIPRPWCAISCWVMIISFFAKKKFLYNFAAITSLLTAVIFYIYPEVGFKNHIAFEEIYSIATHSLLLIGSILLITLNFTDFRYKREEDGIWYEYTCFAVIFIYAFVEIIFKIEKDPLYFMPGNGIIDIIPLPYPLYLLFYIIFVFGIWTNAFYLIPIIKKKIKAKYIN